MDEQAQDQPTQSSVAQWRTELADFEARKHKERPLQNWLDRGRTRAIVLLVASVAIIIPFLSLSIHVVDMLNAAGTAKSFCTSISSGDHNQLYNLLSPRVRKGLSSDQVREVIQNANLAYCDTGTPTATSHRFPDVANFPNVDTLGGTAQVKMQYVLADQTEVYGTMSLVRDGFLTWRVDNLLSLF